MDSVVNTLLDEYKINNKIDLINAFREVFQGLILLSLSKTKFFDNVAFYGGTCLRIFYLLDRFSEDLDFSLIDRDKFLSLSNKDKQLFFNTLDCQMEFIKKDFIKYGIHDLDIAKKNKDFQMLNSYILTYYFNFNIESLIKTFKLKNKYKFPLSFNKNELIKIKLEIYLNPSSKYVTYENKFNYSPYPYKVKCYSTIDMFTSKLHAVLVRKWKNRFKGRDLYDYLFYIKKGMNKINLSHLNERLILSNDISLQTKLTKENFIELLKERFESIDYKIAKEDVVNFVENKDSLIFFEKDVFLDTLNKLDIVD